MSILFPIAATAEAALHAPVGFAAREREAGRITGGDVVFATEAVGPAFPTEAAAMEAYAGRPSDETWRQLRPVSGSDGAQRPVKAPVRPTFRGGRRWPTPATPASTTLWRLSVSYWRIAPAVGLPPPAPGDLRRGRAAHPLEPGALNQLAQQPLRPTRPQQPLDIGLFEVRLPEAPDTLMPDE